MSNLDPKYRVKCETCKHGAGAHKGGGKCAMKHCKCQALKVRG